MDRNMYGIQLRDVIFVDANFDPSEHSTTSQPTVTLSRAEHEETVHAIPLINRLPPCDSIPHATVRDITVERRTPGKLFYRVGDHLDPTSGNVAFHAYEFHNGSLVSQPNY